MSNTENNSVFHYSLHQKLWNILADNPGMDKESALNSFFTKEEKEEFGINDCVACAYTKAISEDNKISCDKCPLDTSDVQMDEFMEQIYNKCGERCLNKLYGTWDTTTDALKTKKDPNYIFATHLHDSNGKKYSEEELKELCSKYAEMIANLPVKEGVPFD